MTRSGTSLVKSPRSGKLVPLLDWRHKVKDEDIDIGHVHGWFVRHDYGTVRRLKLAHAHRCEKCGDIFVHLHWMREKDEYLIRRQWCEDCQDWGEEAYAQDEFWDRHFLKDGEVIVRRAGDGKRGAEQ